MNMKWAERGSSRLPLDAGELGLVRRMVFGLVVVVTGNGGDGGQR